MVGQRDWGPRGGSDPERREGTEPDAPTKTILASTKAPRRVRRGVAVIAAMSAAALVSAPGRGADLPIGCGTESASTLS